MSVEEEQRKEIARLASQVDELQQSLRNATAEADQLRSLAMAGPDPDQLQTVKAELDHERQKATAIWAAVRHVAGEDAARRIEEEVTRRPIVAAPKVRRRGTMPHMPAPHMTVVTKTAATPKWPPATQACATQEEVAPPEPPVQVVAVPIEADQSEQPKPGFDVDSGSVPPSVARRLFDQSRKSKDQQDPGSSTGEPLALKLDGTSEDRNARVSDVPSPMRRRNSSSTSLANVPQLPRQKVSVRSTTPTAAVVNRRVPTETPPPPQVCKQSPATSVRDRIRQLELSARRNSIQN